jgi:hypothetical protein
VEHWDPAKVCHHAITGPLLDVNVDKFVCGIELHVDTGMEFEYLKTINTIDPQQAIVLPGRATTVKLKFQNPMIKPTTRRYGADDEPADVHAMQTGAALERWQPEHCAVPPLRPAELDVECFDDPQADDAETDAEAARQERLLHWVVFRKKFRAYTPFLPRAAPMALADFVMRHTFARYHAVSRANLERCASKAAQRSSGQAMARTVSERLFMEEYSVHTVQHCMYHVLEVYFVFPELVMKVAYELLTSLERAADADPASHAKVYLDALGALVAPPIAGTLALCHQRLAQYWPLNAAESATAVSEAELLSVLKGLYPFETTVRINVDELLSDVRLATDGVLSLDRVRQFFTTAMMTGKEPVMVKIAEMINFKTSLVHWTELDVTNFWEAIRAVCTEEMHDALWVSHMGSCALYGRQNRLPPNDLTQIAAELIWVNMSA